MTIEQGFHMRSNHTLSRYLGILSLVAATLFVAACGGGDDGGSTVASNVAPGAGAAPSPAGTSGGMSRDVGVNSVPIIVSRGLAGIPNVPNVSVTVCVPGTSQCQTISNILLDTGSTGLRLVGSAAFAVLGNLPTSKAGSGGILTECGQFVSGYTWGSVRTADVTIGSLTASGMPIQVIGDQGTTNVPQSCTGGGVSVNTVAQLGANGILGIGPAPYDCGDICVTSKTYSRYYACPNGNASCQITTLPLAQQVSNPVPHFPSGNDGVVIQINAPGAGTATGVLSFGIGTPPPGKTVLTTTTNGDLRSATFAGRTVKYAYMDTGSNGYFFGNQGLGNMPACSDNPFYCPATKQDMSVSLAGTSGEQATVPFSVDNADALFNGGGHAFANLAGPADASTFDLGLPFFYGRTVYIGMDRRVFGSTSLPYIAF